MKRCGTTQSLLCGLNFSFVFSKHLVSTEPGCFPRQDLDATLGDRA